MTWQAINMALPASAQAIADSALPFLDALAADADSAVDAASDAPSLAVQPSDLLGDALAVAALGDAARLAERVRLVTFHPYTFGYGQNKGRGFQQLSFSNVVEGMRAKLRDKGDPLNGGDVEAVAVGLLASSLKQFVDVLAAFNAAFPVADLVIAEHRARALLALDAAKMNDPMPVHVPPFIQAESEQLGTALAVAEAVGMQLGMAQGMTAQALSPDDELAALAVVKKQRIAQVEAKHAELLSTLAFSGFGFYASGSPDTVAALLADDAPGAEFAFSAGLLMVGRAGDLDGLREFFGL